MAHVRIVLVSALTLLLPLAAFPETVMNVSYSWKHDEIWHTSVFYIYFSSDLFDTFHSCLCDNSRTHCCMRLRLRSKGLKWITSSKYHYSSYNYEASHSSSCEQKQNHWYNVQATYSSIYECDFHSRSYHYSPLLKCSRVKQDENAQKTSFSIRGQANYCSVPCVTVRWGGKQTLNNVTSTARGFYDGSYCVADSLKRSTSSDSATTTQSTVPSTTKSTVPPTTKSTVPPTTSIPSTSKTTWKTTQKIQTTKTESQAWEITTQTIQQTVSGDDRTEVRSNKDDTSYPVAVYVVPGVILIVGIVIFVIIWRRKRKQQRRRPSAASRHDVPRAGAISQNIGDVRDGNVGGTVHNSRAASSGYEALNTGRNEESCHGKGNAVGDAYVPTEGATASGFTAVFESGKRFTSDYTNIAALRSTSGASNVYSRPGNQIRKFENPYVDIPALKAHFHKTSGLGESTLTQDSLAMSSLKSSSLANQNNFHIKVTELVSQSFANKAYECVYIENTDSNTKVAFDGNDETRFTLQGTSDPAYEVIGTGESEYTNFPKRDQTIDTEKSEYANFTGRDPAIGTAESEYTNFPKRDTAFGKEESGYDQVISTEEFEYDPATGTEESEYDLATGTEESEYHPATGTEESVYGLATGTEESEYHPATGTEESVYDLATGTEESEYHPATGTEESEYDPATGTEESEYHPATGTEESEYHPATGTEESQYHPATGTEESEYHPATGTEESQYHPATGTEESEYDPATGTEESEYHPATGTEESEYHPATGTEESEYHPATGTEESQYHPATGTEESEYDPATGTEESEYHPATGTEESEYHPATGTEKSEYDPATGTEESEYTNFPRRDPAINIEESEYANCPRRNPEPTRSVYARLGEPMSDIENPYDG